MEKAEGWAYFAKDLWVLADIPDLQDEAQDRLSLNCIDYRILIEVTRKDAYPHPRVYNTLDTLAGSHWFSTLDLIIGYWQVEMQPEDRRQHSAPPKDSVFKVMPFGLCKPAMFQMLCSLVFIGAVILYTIVYGVM